MITLADETDCFSVSCATNRGEVRELRKCLNNSPA